jgi:nucleotide-binding universal stress UspA family protein
MLIVRSILCPVDFSDGSQLALRLAIALAHHRQVALTVLTALDPLLAEAARTRLGMDLAKTEVEPALREFVGGVVPAGALWIPPIVFEVRVGEPSEVILDAARARPGALIVMGTQGLGGFRKLLLGSTTERVLRRTETPVLAVPPHATGSAVLDAAGARIDLRRILVATDFSEAAAAAAEWAVTAAQDFTVPLLFAHVVQPMTVAPQWGAYAAESADAQAAGARVRLEEWAGGFCGDKPCDTIVSLGRPAESIASMADERQAGLIVLGLASDQGRFAQRPGSIAYQILCLSKVPVLVVPGHP